ncbi:MAG: hypothetical protein NZ653_07290 [Anaerolineae bacterium]|nr:hypothetical protein [Anaerolineae bacterium]
MEILKRCVIKAHIPLEEAGLALKVNAPLDHQPAMISSDSSSFK